MDPHSGAGRKMARQFTKGSQTYSPGNGAGAGKRMARPIPRKAKRTAIIFSVFLMGIALLPVLLEGSGVYVDIGPWLSLLITIPVALVAMMFMGFLRDGLAANVVSATAILFALTMGYATTFEPADFDSGRSLMVRAAAPVVSVAVLVYFWISLRTHLRDLHYLIDQGESLQDLMMRYQQANVIRKAGGKPAMTEDGKVVDANELTGRPGFRQKPQKSARQQGERKKRKKPKVR